MQALSAIRRERGFSQRKLAARASLSFKGLQQLEQPGHNWRISSLRQVAQALGLPDHGLDILVEQFLSMTIDSVQASSMWILVEGNASWKHHFFNFVDAFRASPDRGLIARPPAQDLEERLRTPDLPVSAAASRRAASR